jgi:DNA ligase (NAD+)
MLNATYEEVVNIPDIGLVIASDFIEWMQNEANRELIEELRALGLNMEYDLGEIKENYFTGKKCVLTGTLSSMGRNDAKKLIESFGGSLSESVSKKTDILILGENPGSKYDKAKALGIYIMEEAEFLEKIKE